MDLLTRAELLRLSSTDQPGVHLSMFMPTHRFGKGIEGDRLRWKNALTALGSVLPDLGLRTPDAEDLLAPAWTLHADAAAWQHMSDGLVMFLRPGGHETYRVPIDLPELATVGAGFVVGPLLPLLADDEHFLLLAVSQRRVRLLEGTRYRVEEIVLPDVPTSLRDVVEPPEPRSDTMARSFSPAGRSGPAVFYGHGAADEDFKKDEVERFLRQVAAGLDEYIASQSLPLVLVGLDPMVTLYRELTGYSHLMDELVRGNPDQLTAEELHAAAWPVIEQRLRADKRRAVERFGELNGTGMASTDPTAVEDAAAHGRVETLLLAASPSCWERSSTEPPGVLQLGTDASAHCELLDRATVDTLVRGGRIYTFSDSQLPGGGDVAAVFRY